MGHLTIGKVIIDKRVYFFNSAFFKNQESHETTGYFLHSLSWDE